MKKASVTGGLFRQWPLATTKFRTRGGVGAAGGAVVANAGAAHAILVKAYLASRDLSSAEAEASLLMGDAAHTALFTAQDAKTVKYYRIILPSSPTTTMYFSATVSQLEPVTADAEGTEPLKLNCVLKLSGNYTFV